jgi:hypothetical protein
MRNLQPPDNYILSLFQNWLGARCEKCTAQPWEKAYSNDLILLSKLMNVPNSMLHNLLYQGQELLDSAMRPFVNPSKVPLVQFSLKNISVLHPSHGR